MFKKILGLVLSCTLIFVLPIGVTATEPNKYEGNPTITQETIMLDNGDTVTTTLTIVKSFSRGAAESVKADKTIEYETSEGLAWDFTISGTFTYNGITAWASNASNDYNIYFSGWSCTKHTASASGASVRGSAAFKHSNGTSRTTNPTLTCSPNGSFS